jgi:hypothetical protein
MASNPPSPTAVPTAGAPPVRRTFQTQSGSVDPFIIHLIDSKADAVRAELKAHVQTELQSALKPIQADLEEIKRLPGTKTLFAAVFSGALAILAILAFAADRFDGGMAASGALVQQATEQANTIAQINANIAALKSQVQTNANTQGSAGPKQAPGFHSPAGSESSPAGK